MGSVVGALPFAQGVAGRIQLRPPVFFGKPSYAGGELVVPLNQPVGVIVEACKSKLDLFEQIRRIR